VETCKAHANVTCTRRSWAGVPGYRFWGPGFRREMEAADLPRFPPGVSRFREVTITYCIENAKKECKWTWPLDNQKADRPPLREKAQTKGTPPAPGAHSQLVGSN